MHLFSASGVRNYLKEALVNIITVHAEVSSHLSCIFISTQPCVHLLIFVSLQVFTVSKDLVPCVLSKIVESVADEMCRLMQCVSTFSKNGALQVQCSTHRPHGGQFCTHSMTLTQKKTLSRVGEFTCNSYCLKNRSPFPIPPPQARLELCALRDAVATYLNPESKWVPRWGILSPFHSLFYDSELSSQAKLTPPPFPRTT